jgi:spore coat polysaccharide biosynthesis protein SpsF
MNLILKIVIDLLNSKLTIIIQARLGSQRFPKKTIKSIENKPMIWHVINRLKQVKASNQIILATTKNDEDKILLNIADKMNIFSFTGSSNDVLDRYYSCAKKFFADPIIRITGDCPLLDPFLIDDMIEFFQKNNFDYLSNTLEPTYPDGLDVEIFSFQTLEKIMKKSNLKSEHEHVTSYLKTHLNEFQTYNFINDKDLSHHRWTIDQKEDLEFVKKIYSLSNSKSTLNMQIILDIISNNPQLMEINEGIDRDEGYQYSLENDDKIK